jgi:predicted transcriptional regulator
MKTKEAVTTSLRLTPDGKRLLRELATKLGITMVAVIEIAIREIAKREGIE